MRATRALRYLNPIRPIRQHVAGPIKRRIVQNPTYRKAEAYVTARPALHSALKVAARTAKYSLIIGGAPLIISTIGEIPLIGEFAMPRAEGTVAAGYASARLEGPKPPKRVAPTEPARPPAPEVPEQMAAYREAKDIYNKELNTHQISKAAHWVLRVLTANLYKRPIAEKPAPVTVPLAVKRYNQELNTYNTKTLPKHWKAQRQYRRQRRRFYARKWGARILKPVVAGFALYHAVTMGTIQSAGSLLLMFLGTLGYAGVKRGLAWNRARKAKQVAVEA